MTAALNLIGSVSLLAGLLALRLAWRRRDLPHRPLIAGGWAGIIAGFWAFGVSDCDAGLANAALIFMSGAGLLLLHAGDIALRGRRERRPHRRVRPPSSTSLESLPWAGYGRDAASLALALPGAGGTALLAGLALLHMLPSLGLGRTGTISAVFLLVPIIWTGLASYIMLQPRLLRQSAVLACTLAAAGGLVAASA